MAYVYKSQDGESALSYPELAQVWSAHLQGNAAANVVLTKMSNAERRLAEHVYKAFTGDTPATPPKKGKKRAKAIQKARRSVERKGIDPRRARLELLLGHADPWVRETARSQLEGSTERQL